MAAQGSKWDQILKQRFPAFEIEKSVYMNTKAKANQPEIYAKYICDAIRQGDVPDDLLKMYREAVYGSDKKVKERIMKRMYFVGNKTKNEPVVKGMNMLHAPDYANMDLNQLKMKMVEHKKKDFDVQQRMRLESELQAKIHREKNDLDHTEVLSDDDVDGQASSQESSAANFEEDVGCARNVQCSSSEVFSTRKRHSDVSKEKTKKRCLEIGLQNCSPSQIPHIVETLQEDNDETTVYGPASSKTRNKGIHLNKGDIILNDIDEDTSEGNNAWSSQEASKKYFAVYGHKNKQKYFGSSSNVKESAEEKFDCVFGRAKKKKTPNDGASTSKKKVPMENIMTSFNEEALLKKKKQELDEQTILDDCKKFVKMAGTTLINQNALILATSDDKGYDLEKYKKKAMEEMQKQESEGNSEKCNGQKSNSSLSKEKTKSVEELMYESRDDHLYGNPLDCPRIQRLQWDFLNGSTDEDE